MRIHYTVGKDNRNGMNVLFNVEIDEHMLKLIDYLATKISGAKGSALQILWDKYPNGVDEKPAIRWL